MPNTPELELRKTFESSSAGISYDECKIRLGNLTLLEKPINIVAGNDFFVAKKAEYRKSKNYLTSSLAELHVVGQNTSISRINEKLQSFETWDLKGIDRRQELLLALVGDTWKTSLIEVGN